MDGKIRDLLKSIARATKWLSQDCPQEHDIAQGLRRLRAHGSALLVRLGTGEWDDPLERDILQAVKTNFIW